MKEITLYREDNCQYSTSEAKQDDVSGVYVQKEHLTDLQAQNDELRGRLASHERMAVRGIYFTEEELDLFIERKVGLAAKKDEQTLADIRADAVMSIMDKAHSCETPNGDIAYSSELIHDHANEIKGAE